MKKLFILFSLAIGLFFIVEARGQSKIVFAKGSSSKTVTITVAAKAEKQYSLSVRKGQVINVGVSGDIGVSKTNDFPVISINLANGVEDVDRTQDGEAYLSVLAGRTGTFVFNVFNSSKRTRTFTMKVKVTDDIEDFAGGEEVNQ